MVHILGAKHIATLIWLDNLSVVIHFNVMALKE